VWPPTRQRLQQRRAAEEEQASGHRHRLLHAAAAVHCLARASVHPPNWCRCNAQDPGTAADGSSDDAGGSVETSSRAVAKAPVDPARAAARVAEEAQVAQGQRTAVITGAVSIVFGVRRMHHVPKHSDICQLNSKQCSDFVGCGAPQCMVASNLPVLKRPELIRAYPSTSSLQKWGPQGSRIRCGCGCRRVDRRCIGALSDTLGLQLCHRITVCS
jgi:hypothetical protein